MLADSGALLLSGVAGHTAATHPFSALGGDHHVGYVGALADFPYQVRAYLLKDYIQSRIFIHSNDRNACSLNILKKLCVRHAFELQPVLFEHVSLNLWGNNYIIIREITYNKNDEITYFHA